MGSDSLAIGPYTVGEKPAPLVYQFLDSAGVPIDLTGFATEFHFQRADSTAATGAATVSDPAQGKVTHLWLGSELSSPGIWWCEFWAGNGTQRYASKRLEATVRAAVGTAPAI